MHSWGAFSWYDLEQDRTAGAHGAASCQPNGTPETEHIFVNNVPNLVHSSKCVWVTMVTLYGTTNPTQKRMHVIIWDQNRCSRQVSLIKSETARSAPASRPEQAEHVLADPGAVPTKRTVLVNPVLVRTNQTCPW